MSEIRARVISQEKEIYRICDGEAVKNSAVSGKYRYQAATVSDYPAVGDYGNRTAEKRLQKVHRDRKYKGQERNHEIIYCTARGNGLEPGEAAPGTAGGAAE